LDVLNTQTIDEERRKTFFIMYLLATCIFVPSYYM
jgi:hypothetical protein